MQRFCITPPVRAGDGKNCELSDNLQHTSLGGGKEVNWSLSSPRSLRRFIALVCVVSFGCAVPLASIAFTPRLDAAVMPEDVVIPVPLYVYQRRTNPRVRSNALWGISVIKERYFHIRDPTFAFCALRRISSAIRTGYQAQHDSFNARDQDIGVLYIS